MEDIHRERNKLLVAELRSGRHLQGRGKLHNSVNDTKCCLGVACIVAIQNDLGIDVEDDGYQVLYDGNGTMVNRKVFDWYGWTGPEFSRDDPILISDDGKKRFATDLNDHMKLTFDEIADAFERTYVQGEIEEENATND